MGGSTWTPIPPLASPPNPTWVTMGWPLNFSELQFSLSKSLAVPHLDPIDFFQGSTMCLAPCPALGMRRGRLNIRDKIHKLLREEPEDGGLRHYYHLLFRAGSYLMLSIP